MSATAGLAVGISVICWLATSVRWVPRGQWVVVTRGGRVRRVHDAGPVCRVPFVEEFEVTPAAPRRLPLMVRATTNDGVRVLIVAEVTVTSPRPEPGTPYADPWRAAERAAEETVGAAVANWSASELAAAVATSRRTLRHAVSAAVDGHGVAVLELDVVEVDVQLDELTLDRGRR